MRRGWWRLKPSSLALFALTCSTVSLAISTEVLTDSVRAAVFVSGLVLQLVGVAVTLHGLRSIAAELFPDLELPHQSARSWAERRMGTRRPRLPGKLGQAIESEIALPIHPAMTKPRPRAAAPASEWNTYWDSQLEALRSRIDWGLKNADTDTRQLVDKEATERAAADRRLGERLRVVLGGEGGAGLVEAYWGVAAAAVGTVVTGLTGLPI
jgi:hypothetical protein